ncbi:hypothetical protein C922_05732 [Plasmodium inui San Antonio 1]|uniref:Uncharacterized protein n=1 Tax=Plasmodium inui San Antonio 1 TaxID=1237626 RepID=W6ZX53_9APIC|nr:hypothetical protein C922_05732 [Plasmodium inui San Antonio 1]EUD63888.1 hypothetical protein C922_05732 [Plasmodium inui San Antonio 1]
MTVSITGEGVRSKKKLLMNVIIPEKINMSQKLPASNRHHQPKGHPDPLAKPAPGKTLARGSSINKSQAQTFKVIHPTTNPRSRKETKIKQKDLRRRPDLRKQLDNKSQNSRHNWPNRSLKQLTTKPSKINRNRFKKKKTIKNKNVKEKTNPPRRRYLNPLNLHAATHLQNTEANLSRAEEQKCEDNNRDKIPQ